MDADPIKIVYLNKWKCYNSPNFSRDKKCVLYTNVTLFSLKKIGVTRKDFKGYENL